MNPLYPILVENQMGHGYLSKFLKPTDWHYKNIVPKGTPPVDWTVPYDVEKAIGFTLPDKNQGVSGSCGGQMTSYLAQAIFGDSERSAKFAYDPVAQPGGGSYAGDLMARLKNIGVSSEILCPSYENGNPPSEAFMEAPDITAAAINDAAMNKDGGYSFILDFNIDVLAQAIRDNVAIGGALLGQNNGTWLSSFPAPPTSAEWGHFIFLGRYAMINGKKYIGFKNSWGPTVGDKGWQWIGEDYINSGFFELGIVISKTVASYQFNKDLFVGMTDADVFFLQKRLNQNPATQIATSGPGSPGNETYYFGALTKAAVIRYQQQNGITPSVGFVGSITRSFLNK